MGIKYIVSDHGDADGPVGEPIECRTLDLAEALDLFVCLTFVCLTADMSAYFGVQITYVDEEYVVVNTSNYLDGDLYHMFERDPDHQRNKFDKFVFAVSCVVKSVPWICSQRVLQRVVGGDTLYHPA